MENYYEVLEISETASQEVIERVYKLLAKKYHPDLNPDNPKEAEERFKKISAAYDVLSNETKRKQYDEKLSQVREAIARQRAANNAYQAQNNSNQNAYYNQVPNNPNAYYNQAQAGNVYYQTNPNITEKQQEKMRKAYTDAYVAAMEKMGIKVVYKKTAKEHFQSFISMIIAILVFIFIIVFLWVFPPTHDKLVEVYEKSGPFKVIIDNVTNNKQPTSGEVVSE